MAERIGNKPDPLEVEHCMKLGLRIARKMIGEALLSVTDPLVAIRLQEALLKLEEAQDRMKELEDE